MNWVLAGATLLVSLAVMSDFVLAFATAPIEWDAMVYHLHLPARWIHESTIHHVPTFFADLSAGYAPQNGAVIFTWSMLVLNSDAATNALQIVALAAIVTGVYELSRRLNASHGAGAFAAALVPLVEPLREQVFSADVDAWMVSFQVAALALLATYLQSGRRAAMTLAGLAAGLAAGTKTLGLPLALLLFGIALVAVLRHRRPLHLIGFAALAMIGGGFWYLKNLILYDNPLFPLEVGMGPLRFGGAFDVEAVRGGEFHIESTWLLLRNMLSAYGAPIAGVFITGALGLVAKSLSGRGERREVSRLLSLLLLGVSGIWGLYFLFGVPHNTESRFLLPATVGLLPGVAMAFDRVVRRSQALAASSAAALMTVLLWSNATFVRWSAQLGALSAAQVDWQPLLLLALIVSGGLILLVALRVQERSHTSQVSVATVTVLSSILFCAAATEANEDSRMERYSRADFAEWAEGAAFLYNPEVPPMTIAYSGGNVPYVLSGRRLRHSVVYVATRGEVGDGFHEHWVREGRRRYDTYKPPIYQGSDKDIGVWLANLRQVDPTILYLFSLHPFEKAYLAHTAEGFPLESSWARMLPERFELLDQNVASEVWGVR